VVESQMPVSTCSQLGGRGGGALTARSAHRRRRAAAAPRAPASHTHSQQVSCVVRAVM
jgi:hypothetical protein